MLSLNVICHKRKTEVFLPDKEGINVEPCKHLVCSFTAHKKLMLLFILTLLYTSSGLIELILQTLYGWDSLDHRACSIPNTNLLAYPTAFEIESN